MNPETPTGDVKVQSSVTPPGSKPRLDVKIPTLKLSTLTPIVVENNDEADKSSLSDNEATKEFDAAFGFADKQPQDQSKTDDQVDIKLKAEFKEFMAKQRRTVRIAHHNQTILKSAEKKKKEETPFDEDEQDQSNEEEEEGFTSFQSFIDLMSTEELEECLRLLIPIVKLSESQYLIGTK